MYATSGAHYTTVQCKQFTVYTYIYREYISGYIYLVVVVVLLLRWWLVLHIWFSLWMREYLCIYGRNSYMAGLFGMAPGTPTHNGL